MSQISIPSARGGFTRLALVFLVCAQFAVFGQTATSTIAVAATVIKVCVATTTPMAFANYNASGASPNDATATISVLCTLGTTYEIALDAGLGSGATTAGRKMTFLTSLLNYQIYRDAGRSLSFGNSNGTDTVSGTGTGLLVTHTAYGRIATGQYLSPGAYVDTVTVTVTY